MKLKQKKTMKNENAITLIALVVTIVVLLILAAVSIGMLTGENGIITQAVTAKEQTVIADEKESISIAYTGCMQNNMFNEIVTDEQLQEELSRNGRNTTVTMVNTDDLQVVFNETKHRYVIEQNGEIEQLPDLNPEESEKIIDVVTLGSEENIYVLTASGEVKSAEIQRGNYLDELKVNNEETLTVNGVRKKGKNWFIDNKGKVYTWGDNEYGKLGDGTTYDSNIPICISDIEGNALKGKNIIDVYRCYETVIARDSEGKVYTWGNNGNGLLGDGITIAEWGYYRNSPICISDIEGNALKGKNIIDIYCDYATVIARDSEGKVYTWGENEYGKLGDGTTYDSNIPICISDIEGNALKGKNIVDISDGWTIIARDNEGKVYTWGENYYGQLGNGTTSTGWGSYCNIPICISDIEGNALKGKNIIDISNGSTIIARDNEGKVYTWGRNGDGKLGDGTNNDSNIPICISDIEGNSLKGKNIIDISNDSTIIARDSEGKVYTWGDNEYGKLGNGTTDNSNVPICISNIDGNELKGKNITDVYSDGYTVIAKDSNGKIYTWGENEYGKLGNGTTDNSNIPICISNIDGNELKGKNIIDISGSYAIIARDSKGKVYAWGR